jgi:hypothetical protein
VVARGGDHATRRRGGVRRLGRVVPARDRRLEAERRGPGRRRRDGVDADSSPAAHGRCHPGRGDARAAGTGRVHPDSPAASGGRAVEHARHPADRFRAARAASPRPDRGRCRGARAPAGSGRPADPGAAARHPGRRESGRRPANGTPGHPGARHEAGAAPVAARDSSAGRHGRPAGDPRGSPGALGSRSPARAGDSARRRREAGRARGPADGASPSAAVGTAERSARDSGGSLARGRYPAAAVSQAPGIGATRRAGKDGFALAEREHWE